MKKESGREVDLIAALNLLEKEVGISKDIMFETIEKSLMDEYKTQFNTTDNVNITVDRVTGAFHIYAERTVVEEVKASDNVDEKKSNQKYISATDIALEDARKVKPGCQLGDVITIELKADEFSRRAASKAKGTIIQKIREEEKSAIYNEFHSKEKEIITGIVQRIDEKGNIFVDLGRSQTTLKVADQVKGEKFERGDRIKLYVVSVTNNTGKDKKRVSIRVSRTAPELVKRLFEEEVTEIKDGVVEIMGIAREAGSRTKMAVRAKLPNIDPVGACVGVNGARVKAIVSELGNEQIDIIEWSENSAQLIVNALSPAKVVSAMADDDEKKAQIVVSEQQLSLAIGKSGQNVRLAAKLTGYGIDIKSEAQVGMDIMEDDMEDGIEEFEDTYDEELNFEENTEEFDEIEDAVNESFEDEE